MIPTDFHIFQRGWSTTNQKLWGLKWQTPRRSASGLLKTLEFTEFFGS